jgi:hypothetical protein
VGNGIYIYVCVVSLAVALSCDVVCFQYLNQISRVPLDRSITMSAPSLSNALTVQTASKFVNVYADNLELSIGNGRHNESSIIRSFNPIGGSSRPRLTLTRYDDSFLEPDWETGTLMSVVTRDSSGLGGPEQVIPELPTRVRTQGADPEHRQVQILDYFGHNYIMQRRDGTWKQWYHDQRKNEAQADQIIQSNEDLTDAGINTALFQAYEILKVHQLKPEASMVVPVLQQYKDECYEPLETRWSIVEAAIKAWDGDQWDKELNKAASKEQNQALVISMIGALALSQRHHRRHLIPANGAECSYFALLLAHCRKLERLCLLNVNVNLFLNPADAPASSDASEVNVERPWRTRSGYMSDDD